MKSKSTLFKLPCEVRHMIFRPLLLWTGKKGCTASILLATLRPEPQLYNEALAIFRRENIWDRLLPRAHLDDWMSATVIRAIERLAIWDRLGTVQFLFYFTPLLNTTQIQSDALVLLDETITIPYTSSFGNIIPGITSSCVRPAGLKACATCA